MLFSVTTICLLLVCYLGEKINLIKLTRFFETQLGVTITCGGFYLVKLTFDFFFKLKLKVVFVKPLLHLHFLSSVKLSITMKQKFEKISTETFCRTWNLIYDFVEIFVIKEIHIKRSIKILSSISEKKFLCWAAEFFHPADLKRIHKLFSIDFDVLILFKGCWLFYNSTGRPIASLTKSVFLEDSSCWSLWVDSMTLVRFVICYPGRTTPSLRSLSSIRPALVV